jgi:glycerol-3-phosphate O-acyltransferase
VEAYQRENVALATSTVAFTAFELLRRANKHLDLFRLLRTLGPETSLSLVELEQETAKAQAQLKALEAAGRIRLDPALATDDAAGLVRRALRTFATYHARPVLERRGVRVHPNEPSLLFYYRNRLEGYGLLGAPDLLPRRREP